MYGVVAAAGRRGLALHGVVVVVSLRLGFSDITDRNSYNHPSKPHTVLSVQTLVVVFAGYAIEIRMYVKIRHVSDGR